MVSAVPSVATITVQTVLYKLVYTGIHIAPSVC
jgi:hypothetical protein